MERWSSHLLEEFDQLLVVERVRFEVVGESVEVPRDLADLEDLRLFRSILRRRQIGGRGKRERADDQIGSAGQVGADERLGRVDVEDAAHLLPLFVQNDLEALSL